MLICFVAAIFLVLGRRRHLCFNVWIMKLAKLFWRKWLTFARAIGNFQGQVILTLFYWFLLLPVGVVFRIFADPLRLKKRRYRSNFQKWEHLKETLETSRRQY